MEGSIQGRFMNMLQLDPLHENLFADLIEI